MIFLLFNHISTPLAYPLKTSSSNAPLRFPSGISYVLLMYFLCISYVLNINTT